MRKIFRNPKNRAQTEEAKSLENSKPKEYENIFINRGKINVREGKAIYIRADFHKTIARIAQTIGSGKISLTDYVDNVFEHHFRHYEQEIKESFNNNNKPIL